MKSDDNTRLTASYNPSNLSLDRRNLLKDTALALGMATATGGLIVRPAWAAERPGDAPAAVSGKVSVPASASFGRDEYLGRIAKTKAAMNAAGIDVLMVSNPSNMCYVSGFAMIPYYYSQFVIVSLDDPEPLWVGSDETVAVAAQYTVFMNDDRIFVDPGASSDPMEFVADLVRTRGWERKRIGIEMNDRNLPYASGASLQARLPNARWLDASGLVGRMRIVKSDREVEYMRQAGVIADNAMRVGIDAVKAGVRQCDAAGAMMQAMFSGTPEYPGYYPEGMCIGTGRRSASPALHWPEGTFHTRAPDNVAVIELVGSRHYYHVQLTRTVVLGKPTEKLQKQDAAIAEGIDIVLDAARPGVVAAAYVRCINRHGFETTTGVAGATGIGFTGLECNEPTGIDVGSKTVLQANMTLHLSPFIEMDKGDFRPITSEVFQISKTGRARSFCALERRLYVKP